MRRLLFILLFMASASRALAQAPPPVPALPDTERRTSYAITSSTCNCSVNFALYGDGTDYYNWIEVFINGIRVNSTDPAYGWSISSPTGPLAFIPRPVTDAVLNFNQAQTGTIQIVGARRPRRTTQFQEGRGVAARDLNQALTDIIAENRETWDKLNDVSGRTLMSQPGNTVGMLPTPANCISSFLAFDSTGLNPECTSIASVTTGIIGPGSTTAGDLALWNSTNGTLLEDSPLGSGVASALSHAPNTSGGVALYAGGGASIPVAANNTALQGLASTSSAYVMRQSFANAGDAPPMIYYSSASPCSLNGGSGDNGSQVKSSDGNCWLAIFPSAGLDVREWGACVGNDDTTALQAAIAAATPGQTVLIPQASPGCKVSGTLTIANSVRIQGAGPGATIYGTLSSGADLFHIAPASASYFYGIQFSNLILTISGGLNLFDFDTTTCTCYIGFPLIENVNALGSTSLAGAPILVEGTASPIYVTFGLDVVNARLFSNTRTTAGADVTLQNAGDSIHIIGGQYTGQGYALFVNQVAGAGNVVLDGTNITACGGVDVLNAIAPIFENFEMESLQFNGSTCTSITGTFFNITSGTVDSAIIRSAQIQLVSSPVGYSDAINIANASNTMLDKLRLDSAATTNIGVNIQSTATNTQFGTGFAVTGFTSAYSDSGVSTTHASMTSGPP